jgi:hypothetical protein
VAEAAAVIGVASEMEQLARDRLRLLRLAERRGDLGERGRVGDPEGSQRRMRRLELLDRAAGDRPVDRVRHELRLDLVELVEVHLELHHRARAHAGAQARIGGDLAGDQRRGGAVARVALQVEHGLGGDRRRRRGPGLGCDLLGGSVRHALAHRPTLPDPSGRVKRPGR